MVFYKKLPIYNPQKTLGKKNHSKGREKTNANNNYGDFNFVDNSEELGDMKHPKSILQFEKPHPSVSLHPTQKNSDLCMWLLRTYTNEGAIVLDNCMGSGTTAVAALNTNRKFIGFETEPAYIEIANKRIDDLAK
jgi:site-specific DNA-methyltransferase (adenine-specific)